MVFLSLPQMVLPHKRGIVGCFVKTTVLSHLAHPLFNMTRFGITRIPFAHIETVKIGFGIPLVKVDARIGFGIRWSKLMLGRVALEFD